MYIFAFDGPLDHRVARCPAVKAPGHEECDSNGEEVDYPTDKVPVEQL